MCLLKSYFQQLSTDVITAAAYVTDLLNQNLTDSNWYKNGDYLPSYSVNYYDIQHRRIFYTQHTEFSLYYAKVDAILFTSKKSF